MCQVEETLWGHVVWSVSLCRSDRTSNPSQSLLSHLRVALGGVEGSGEASQSAAFPLIVFTPARQLALRGKAALPLRLITGVFTELCFLV